MDAPAENAASSPIPDGAAAPAPETNGNGGAAAEASAPAEVKKEPRLYKFLRFLVAQKASDLHIKSNLPPHIRLKNRIGRSSTRR